MRTELRPENLPAPSMANRFQARLWGSAESLCRTLFFRTEKGWNLGTKSVPHSLSVARHSLRPPGQAHELSPCPHSGPLPGTVQESRVRFARRFLLRDV